MSRQKHNAATVAILAESSRIGWPQQFATDLTHDARAIAAMSPGEPFAWCLRADGTHIGRVIDPRVSLRSQLTMRMVGNAFDDRFCRFYVWDGSALHAVTSAAEADARLAEIAAARIQTTQEGTSP